MQCNHKYCFNHGDSHEVSSDASEALRLCAKHDQKHSREFVYLSESLAYASHPCYAAEGKHKGKRAVVVLEFRIAPYAYKVGPSTLKSTPKDEHVEKHQMEHYTDRTGVMLLTGILVQVDCSIDSSRVAVSSSRPDSSPQAIASLRKMISDLEICVQPTFHCHTALLAWNILSFYSLNPSLFDHRFDE